MLGKFRLYHLDSGSFVVVCGACGCHLILAKGAAERMARKNTVLGEVEEENKDVGKQNSIS